MKILVLNGFNPTQQESNRFRNIISKAAELNGFDYEIIDLHTKKIQKCQGCFDCWVRTPGECFVQDDSQEICKRIINCNLLVLLTPIVFGGYSSVLKKMLDRIIPLISPFFGKYEGEIHHRPRYKKYPNMLGVGIHNYSSDEEAACFKKIVYRNSLNLRSRLTQATTFLNSDSEYFIQNTINEIFVKMEDKSYAK